MNFEVRAASASDISAMHRVRRKVRQNRLSDPQRISEASYLPYILAGSAWVAETDEGILGFAVVDGPAATVWALFVDPDVEGVGVGCDLHMRMLQWAREQGMSRLCLCTEDGTRALEFYKRAGWKQVGICEDGQIHLEISLGS